MMVRAEYDDDNDNEIESDGDTDRLTYHYFSKYTNKKSPAAELFEARMIADDVLDEDQGLKFINVRGPNIFCLACLHSYSIS